MQLDISDVSAITIGTSADDTLTGTGNNDFIQGLAGNDTLDGQAGNDVISGGDGNDTLIGDTGNDLLYGNNGDDVLNSGVGNDFLYGGKGDDTLTGGTGKDVFVFEHGDEGTIVTPTVDIVTDFDTSNGIDGDQINLADMLQGATTNNLTSYLHFSYSGGDTTIEVSSTGGGIANTDQKIVLQGVDLTAGGTLSDADIINNLLTNNKLIIDE